MRKLRSSARLATATWLAAAFLACLAGCLPGLTLVSLKATSAKPSNVAVYFTVDTNDGKPVASLTADQFTIFEDGTRISVEESKQTLLSPKVAAAHYTLLLVDMSGTILGSKEVGEIIKAASAFSERVEGAENVAVYAFDGSPELSPIVPFTTSEGAGAAGGKPKDPSTNLNGAIILGLKTLKKALAADTKALKFGTLVVFTDGTGHGGRTRPSELRAALAAPANASFDVFAVGIGTETDALRLAEIGKSGTLTEPDPANVTQAFDKIAAKVEAAAARFYLLSYCTPSRGGFHDVRIEAHAPDGLIGDLTYRFSADGFGDGCDPTTPGGFDLAHPSEPAPVPATEKKDKKEPAKKPVKRPHPTPSPGSTSEPTTPATPSPAPPPPPNSDPFAP